MKAAIIVLSTRSFLGTRKDLVTPALEEILTSQGFTISGSYLIEDCPEKLKALLINLTDNEGVELIITSGGTGLSPNDITPETTRLLLHREVTGIAEAIRIHSLQFTPMAMLSRGVAGIRHQTLIINLPGSPKAVREILEYLKPAILHALPLIKGEVIE